MKYRYTRINAHGKKEILYTKDVNKARIYDKNPIACIGQVPRDDLMRNLGAGFIACGLFCALMVVFFGPQIVEFFAENDAVLCILCVLVLFGTAVGTFIYNMQDGGDDE